LRVGLSKKSNQLFGPKRNNRCRAVGVDNESDQVP
jgi:hypothetical protein